MKTNLIIFKNNNGLDWRLTDQSIPASVKLLGVIQVEFKDVELISFNSIELIYINEFYYGKKELINLMLNSSNFDFYFKEVKEEV